MTKHWMKARRNPHRGRPRRMALWLGAVVGLLAASATAVPRQQQDLGDTKSALELLIETRGVVSKEKRDWTLGKELLQERIELRKREVAALEGSIAEAEVSIAEADQTLDGLVEQEAELSATEATLRERVTAQEARTLALLARSPEFFRSKVELFAQRIPTDPAATKLTLGERYQNVIAVLNAANKFNQQIEITSELRSLPGGKSAEVVTMYLGLGQAYYVSPDRTVAGIGRPSADAWEWTPDNAVAEEIDRAIKIQQGEVTPDFVSLPVRVQ